ncbi:MAM and LDL-receptor class A domain-containing protein 1-like [Diadema antillarum]|uniref:MAM and LDL-receptor class A domain-containing protein 1-like n=1 Tax=Diadema antillarum TaxID=105358 RepID=UPI003A89E69C
MISPAESASKAQCVQFYYFMLGEHMGSIRVYARANTSSTLGSPLWERSGEQGKQWYRGVATVPKMSSDQFAEVVFEAEIGSGVRSDIAIDDIEVINANGDCPLESFQCDFDSGWCGIKQDTTDNFNFVRKKGSTSSTDTGPSSDHTSGKGYYVYIEASGLTANKKARIITPLFRGVQGNDKETFCVVFYYHMYGETVGELSVYLRNDSSTQLGDPIWWISGNRGDIWRGAEAEIKTPRDFNLYFEAIRGRSYTSDIALDDIVITSYGCPGHHIVDDVTSVSCDFEQATLCHYEQDKTDDFNWSWRNRGTKDGFTGPSVDHTRGDELGFFVFITSTYSLNSADKARLISPVAKSNARSSCVVFWYHMFGDDIETMNVYIMPDGGTPPGNNRVWTKSSDQGNYWHYTNFKIPANSGNVRIVFEASPGDKNRDDIAIDDVMLYEGQDCPPFVTTAPPPTTKPPAVNDISCDFETDYCGYINMKDNDDMDWSRAKGRGSSTSTYTGPGTDHTLGTAAGYYLSFDPRPINGATLGDNAIMISPLLAASGQTRCLSLYAYMYGYAVDFLSIYTRPWGGTRRMDPITFAYGDKGKMWFEIQMDLPPSPESFEILFEAICGRSRYSSEIAVDDIKIISGNCGTATEKPIPWGVDCDFEQDGTLCGYINYPSDDFDWVRHSGSTPSDHTGPRFDHTRGTTQGHYMYIESSIPQRPDKDAILVSPLMNSQFDDLCIRFYYHAYGDDTGALSVKLQSFITEDEILLFSVSGNRGDEWIPANVNIPSEITGGADFQIKFVGKTGMGFLSDIAIDDIKFLPQPCEGFPSEAVCTFEQGLDFCGYDNNESADLVWRWYDALATEDPPINEIISGEYAAVDDGYPG